MASSLYRNFIETMLAPGNASNGHSGATIDLLDVTTNVVSISLVDSGTYTFSEDHDYYDDITAAAIVSNSATAISTPVFGDGTTGARWDAANFNSGGAGSLTNIGDGVDSVDAIIIWVNTAGASSTDPVVAYIDTGTGFGVTPNASTVDIVWHADGIINFNYI